ncbi:MAG: hypothetical protein QY304_02860 [Candidatus Paceibacterota bacterium]|nr:MAG: hypothetical protein QY304_02860 [Candidatus Paceibacterota bacterium]
MAISAKATQEFVPIKEIRNGIITLKDGSLRAILMVSSTNFALKSEEERKAIIFQFQNLLNSLDFSVQIVVQSRRLDIRPYLALLEEREKAQKSDLMKIQVREYIGFIKAFTENTNIMTKHFFIVIPYTPSIIKRGKGGGISLANFRRKEKNVDKKESEGDVFEENLTQLEQRISVLEQGLISFGLRTVVLRTEEVVELFYKTFNPGELEKAIKLEE